VSNRKSGFDPQRLGILKRDRPVIPQMLSDENEARARGFTEIRVIGVGGAGSNTVDHMIEADVRGIDFIVVNSDLQALQNSRARRKIAIGQHLTHGLGAGGDARLGMKMAEYDREVLQTAVHGADMVFVTAGMGGGTGTGAAPVIAEMARAAGALTVGVVTRPFRFEGRRRQETAETGLRDMRATADALIVIANERLMEIAPPTTNFLEAFKMADEVLHQGIKGVADLILTPGLINLDFADVYSVMARSGSALMALGRAQGPNRAKRVAELALASPLLETPITGARGVLLNITGSPDMTLHEVQTVAEYITNTVHADANIIFGAIVHPRLDDEMRLTLIATGFG
jgi:cell division protein FtsZ